MFRAKTVFVLGAGASYEVDMPIGSELLTRIAAASNMEFDLGRLVRGDDHVHRALVKRLGGDVPMDEGKAYILAGRQLARSACQAASIDDVIDALEDERLTLLAKFGIVREILRAEGGSKYFSLRGDDSIDLTRFDGTWYRKLSDMLREGVRRSALESIFQNIEIINFNYDRSLEAYLPHSLADFYGVSHEQMHEIMSSLIVHRPYGCVGRLPWQSHPLPSIRFGDCSPNHLMAVSDSIRTYSERVEEGEALRSMRRAIATADRIVFLGFAFHRQNLDLLATEVRPECELLGTVFGITGDRVEVIRRKLGSILFEPGDVGEILLVPAKCVEFMHNYSSRLTAEVSH